MTMPTSSACEQESCLTTSSDESQRAQAKRLPTTPPQKPSATAEPSANLDHNDPQSSQQSHGDSTFSHSTAFPNPLTPPLTPEKVIHKLSSLSSPGFKSLTEASKGLGDLDINAVEGQRSTKCQIGVAQNDAHAKLLLFQSDYSRYEELGRGAWSTVYSATQGPSVQISSTSAIATAAFPLTPPNSPPAKKSAASLLLAVKVPARRDARPILEKEGRILTHAVSKPKCADYVVPFYGFHVPTWSLVMADIPMDLDNLIKTRRSEIRQMTVEVGRYDPILTTATWLDLASHLVSGLIFLHDNSIFHGDIKPSNVLVQPEATSTHQKFKYLYCDFSSSRIAESVGVPSESELISSDDEITAITTEYAAPELLTTLRESVRDSSATRAVATAAADVYALGVTLLVAATGDSPYEGVQMEMQRLSMAREGRPLEFMRSGGISQALRVKKNGLVDRCLEGSVRRDETKRFSLSEWMNILASARVEEEVKTI